MQLLVSLNEPYSIVCGLILIMSSILDTCRIHGLILQHEQQMDVANQQIGSHVMQTNHYIKGSTRSSNLVATKPFSASYGDDNSHG
jgi:hypothetical protein